MAVATDGISAPALDCQWHATTQSLGAETLRSNRSHYIYSRYTGL